MSNAADQMFASLNRLCKWRAVLAGRHVGTKPRTDPETQAFRELYDKLLILRAEHTALVALLCEKGLITHDEFASQVVTEAQWLEKQYEQAFPGVRATDTGLVINRRAADWMKDLKP